MTRNSLFSLAAWLLIGTVATGAARADGELDPSFSAGGVAVVDGGGASDEGGLIALAPDGSIALAGSVAGDDGRDVLVARLDASGALDPSFGTDGRTIVSFGGDEEVADLALDREGRLVVVGTRVKDDAREVFLMRFLPSGELDPSFDGDGRRVFDFGFASSGAALAVQIDGRIAVAGSRENAAGSVFAAARLLSDGSFDTSFSGNGKATADFGLSSGRESFARDIAIQDDGGILVAGMRTGTDGADFAIARFRPDGELDTSFSGNGKADVDFGGEDEARAVAIRPDGRIAVAGVRRTDDSDFAVAVLRADGELDTSFSGNGKATADFAADESAAALLALPDGHLLLAGVRRGASGDDFALARYDRDGALDPALDGDGKLRLDLGGDDEARSAALLPDGRILAAGETRSGDVADLVVARILAALSVPAAQLEIPGDGSMQSGIGLVSGWLCDGPGVKVKIDGRAAEATAYGTPREDTRAICGDADNGFGLLFNWNLLGDGPHILRAFAAGRQIGMAVFSVTTLGTPFLRGASGSFDLADFPTAGASVEVTWSEGLQGFVLSDARGLPARADRVETPLAGEGLLENPAPGSRQSGIGVISGWVCEASTVEIVLDEGQPIAAAYGTTREDTRPVCGDADNGFGLLFNWNLLGDGMHTAVARVDGEVLGSASFSVTTLGTPFLRGASGTFSLADFPEPGRSVEIRWAEGQQNFVLTAAD